MKFQQRLAMLSSAGGCAVVYLLLLYTQGVVQVWHGPAPSRHRRSLFAEYESDQKYWNPTLTPLSCAKLQMQNSEEFVNQNDTVLTINLPSDSNYNVYSNNVHGMSRHSDKPEKAEKLNVIILPHSHVDAGWLRTVEEYYVINVKKILNNMVSKLNKYENMTFVWAETVFLSMWWNELDDHVKLQVRRLIQKGQLEIASGGWVMADEASTHYVSLIDQLAEGHQWILENLHTKPVNSWSIDPFGHSSTMSYLWKQAGIDNMVIQRVHQAIKVTLARKKSLEFKWRQLWDGVGSTDTLCHIMPYVYYGVQYTCGPDRNICSMYDYGKPNTALNEMSPGKHVTKFNVAQQAKYLYGQYKLKAALYKYNTILVPIGDDFRFDNADEWDHNYDNYMKLISYMNAQTDWNINVKFGTLTDFFNQIKSQEKTLSKLQNDYKFPVLQGDFFPYSDQNSEYWTGFYTTRPFLKQMSRNVESDLRAADILNVLVVGYSKVWNTPYSSYHDIASQLQTARRNLALFQHHDAITGTAKPHVVEDYESKLYEAYQLVQDSIVSTVQTLLTRGKFESPTLLSPVSTRPNPDSILQKYTIPIGQTNSKVVIFNSIAQERTEFVHLIVNDVNIEIRNSEGNNIPFQVNPIFKMTTKLVSSEYEVVFLAEVSPLGIQTYTLHKIDERHDRYWTSLTTYSDTPPSMPDNLNVMYASYNAPNSDLYLENEFMRLNFNNKGFLETVLDKESNRLSQIQIQFLAYKSEGSGAYLFYPSGEAEEILGNTVPEIRVFKGPFMEQIQVMFKYLTHTVTVYDTPTVQGQGIRIQNELNMDAKAMPNSENTEVIMRLSSDVKNKGIFYTDQNGYQLIGRRTDPMNNIETNYYPMTSMALIEDGNKRVTLHASQSHGVASLRSGWLEVMLDRKVLGDDKKGLGEGVTDNRLTVSNFILQIEFKNSDIPSEEPVFTFPSLASIIQNDLLQQPLQTLFTTVKSDVFLSSFHPVNHSLPCDVSIVGLKNNVDSDLAYSDTSLIFHKKSYSCDYLVTGLQCSLNDRQISIKSILPEINLHDARETTLTNLYTKAGQSPDAEIRMKPMELKSYYFRIK